MVCGGWGDSRGGDRVRVGAVRVREGSRGHLCETWNGCLDRSCGSTTVGDLGGPYSRIG